LIGSDYPFGMGCDNPVEAVLALGLAPAQQHAVLGGTLSRLLKL